MDTTRASLLVRVRDRQDSTAWQEFHRLYSGLIESYARVRGLRHQDAAELAAECMSVLVAKMPEFEYDQLKGRFRGWLRRMVNNKIIDQHRKRKMAVADTHQLLEVPDRAEDSDEHWERVWQQAHLGHCLEKLRAEVPAAQFEAFRLYGIEEWPVEKVAGHLGLTKNQVYLAKSRLAAKLREAWEELLGVSQ